MTVYDKSKHKKLRQFQHTQTCINYSLQTVTTLFRHFFYLKYNNIIFNSNSYYK